ncbi:nuclear transport factor 2 family protein [Spirillospora sp. NPDC048911]|uniref:nuclear transport factor 2 family protein n=1 Tax=Spirillospora sp. NPDC048911 TaxID=3364527 RepID=UPI00371DF959
MSSKTVEELYAAFAAGDPARLLATLHPDLVLTVSAGMPLGVGGGHHGPQDALRDCWGVIVTAYETAPVPEEFVWPGTERCVVFGHYRGRVRATGAPFEAAFAHDLRLRDDLIVAFTQITDTAEWPDVPAA